MACLFDLLQHVAQLAGGALGRRSRIVEFMRQPGGKFAQSSKAVALLLDSCSLADSVRHQRDETAGQLGHLLYQVRETCGREAQHTAGGNGPGRQRKLLHSGKRQDSTYVSRLGGDHHYLAPDLASCLELTLKDDKHRVCGIALVQIEIGRASCRERV